MLTIAVDFDGTIVEHAYPEIGEVKLFAFETLKELQKNNCRLILWTYRTGKELEDAVYFCRENEIEFDAINSNYPGEEMNSDVSRKINADIYIDDKNLGGFPGWSETWQLIAPIIGAENGLGYSFYKKEDNSWISRLFKKKT